MDGLCRSYQPVEVAAPLPEEDTSSVAVTLSNLSLPELRDKLQVCKEYLKHNCSLTTCPYAHPHIRDKAKVFYMRCDRVICVCVGA